MRAFSNVVISGHVTKIWRSHHSIRHIQKPHATRNTQTSWLYVL